MSITWKIDEPLDIRRRWAEMFCTNPFIWQELADEYRDAGRLSMAAYCEAHARHYAGDEHETVSNLPATN
ncbi:MAG: hypothetical protein ANABAC_1321 [Anaerolineae bacterium]|nr:MAG: hypothetical protein ANABAC_1321 [Anaerolineae bacterium]